MKQIKFTPQQTMEFLSDEVYLKSTVLESDSKKHVIVGHRNFKKIFDFHLPLPFPRFNLDEHPATYLTRLNKDFPPYLILLIQAGYAAIGYFEDGQFSRHKTLRTYVVRKGHGKSQLSLSKNGKGKSSGSQLRYQNAIHFFEDINRTLNDWNVIDRCERILFSCPINLLSFLFNSKVKCAIDKDDLRLQKIPLDVRVPNYEELLRVNERISFGYLTYCELEDLSSKVA